MTAYEAFAADVQRSSDLTPPEIAHLLEDCDAELVRQIRSLRTAGRRYLSYWGCCSNRDELADQQIVDPRILQAIGLLAGYRVNLHSPHAGWQHTYGYLFSTITTPFGRKGDRWNNGTVAAAAGIDLSLLTAIPREGTLLENATALCLPLLLRNQHSPARGSTPLSEEAAAMTLEEFNVKSGRHVRIEESVTRHWYGKQRSWALQTDIWRQTGNQHALLVYSIRETDPRRHRLITVFPINAEGENALLNDRKPGCSEVRLRFNADVPALRRRRFTGDCRIFEFPV